MVWYCAILYDILWLVMVKAYLRWNVDVVLHGMISGYGMYMIQYDMVLLC